MEDEPEEFEEQPEEEGALPEEELPLEEEAPVEGEAVAPFEEEPLVSPEAVPVTLKVELGSLEMSAEKLLSLSPGNLLELPSRPDSAVSLTVNGKRVGRGELMMMGDMLGVRVLELGK